MNDIPSALEPLTVYLDSADYSNFAKVIEGSGSQENADIFEKLKDAKRLGKARFAFSLTTLSELLQYDPYFEERTRLRAEAVEILCGEDCFIWPMRSVALEIAKYDATRVGGTSPALAPLSTDGMWFPSTESVMTNLKAEMKTRLEEEIQALGPLNRSQRRAVHARLRQLTLSRLAVSAAPELAEKYGLRVEDVRSSIGAVLDNKISAAEGSRRLFSAIGRPTTFVQAYFLASDGEKDFPNWIPGYGKRLQGDLLKLRENFEEIRKFGEPSRDTVDRILDRGAEGMTRTLIVSSMRACDEFDVPEYIVEEIANSGRSAWSELLSVSVFHDVFRLFLQLNLGLGGGGNRPEQGAGGDLMHILHLPYAGLMRVDQRFSEIVRRAVPQYAPRLVSKLRDLPELIDSGR